jgi:hypothetical protein
MTSATAAPERFDIGRVISGGFAIVARRPVTLIVLTALFGFLPSAATLWLTTDWPPPGAATGAADLGAIFRRLGIVELIGVLFGGMSWILQGSVAAAAISDFGGRPLSVTGALARAAPRMPVVYVLGVLATLGIGLGTIALIVPGILLALAWSVGSVVATVENTGFKSFGRSAELTRNCRGSLFVIFLLYGVASMVFSFVARIVGGVGLVAGGGAAPLWVTIGLQPLAGAVVQIFMTATIVSAYVELRGVKEGLAASNLATLFD